MNTLELVGANAFVAEDHPNLYLPDRLWLLKTSPNVRCRWLAYYMKTMRFRGQIVDIASGTSGSMKNISKGRLAELPIYVPGIELQDAAIEVLTSVEQAALRSADALESNKRVRESLSGDLLSGRVRVPA
jgi:restriction endonuclease S subunit